MSIVHQLDPDAPAAFECVQGGCRVCLNALMDRHRGLVQVVLRRQGRGSVPYDDLLQEGRIGLWQAILHFDPHRGVAFSTYAGVAIKRRIWWAVARANRPQAYLPPAEVGNPLEIAEGRLWQAELHTALIQAVSRLPDRLRQIVVGAYGLDGLPHRTLAAVGQQLDLTRERVRQLRNDALVLLRLPAFSARLRHLHNQDTRAGYARSQALSCTWLRLRRRRG